MPQIAINLNDVPDEMPKVDPGIYTAVVKEIELGPTKDEKGERIKATLEIEDGPAAGRRLFSYMGLGNDFGRVALKKFTKSCGMPLGNNINVEDYLGKVCKIRVATRTYKDSETGETKESPDIKEFLTA